MYDDTRAKVSEKLAQQYRRDQVRAMLVGARRRRKRRGLLLRLVAVAAMMALIVALAVHAFGLLADEHQQLTRSDAPHNSSAVPK